MSDIEPGLHALHAIDAVLAAKPEKDGHQLSQAMLCLCAYRDAVTPPDWDRASAADRDRLTRLNAIISVVMALHFPIGEPPWDDFAAARGWLADLLGEMPPVTAAGR